MQALNLYQIFLLFVLGQGLFLASILLTLKKGDRLANKLLAGVVFLMTYYTFAFFLNDTGYRRFIPVLLLNGYSIAPLIPVLFYFYLNQVTTGKIVRNYGIHFVPFLIQFMYWLPNNSSGIFHTLSDEALSTYYSLTIVRIVSGIHIIIFATYNFIFFRKIKFQKYTIRKEKIDWLKKVRILYTIMVVIFSLGLFSLWFTSTDIARYIFFSFLSFFVYVIGYYGYTKSETLFDSSKQTKAKYLNSKLSKQESNQIYDRLLHLMENEKLYLDSSVKLADVASILSIAPHTLSRVINENHQGNFMDFMNRYRVFEAKRILLDTSVESPKMFAVALDSGFGNKVSFYKNFKKFTGNLPNEFRNQLNQ